jgi:hypothetical protein
MALLDRPRGHGRQVFLTEGHGLGARIVVETIHRVIEASVHSIVRSPEFRPNLGSADGRFRLADLLLFAVEGKEDLLAPHGD